MSRIPFDRALDVWMAEGPDQLPDYAVDRIFRTFDESEARKPAWLRRRDRMNRWIVSVAGIAAALIIAVVGAAYLVGRSPGVGGPPAPTQTPAPTPGPTASPNVFTSDRHAYSLVLPDGWAANERAGEWAPGTLFRFDGPGYDEVIRLSGSSAEIGPWLSSQLIPEGQTFEQWRADYDARTTAAFPNCPREGDFETGLVDGESARIGTYLCTGEANLEAVWSHAGRAYVFRLADEQGVGASLTRAQLDAWLARFEHTD